ncbi:MAG: DUF1015 family protein [Fibromonadaceae bacterium]|jgi:uncharacterized protein (DUF1015 family)|nr:DUF1015 family protein [Fibromonadaceae bacterium]
MFSIHPFRALRPKPELAAEISSLPYDVMNRDEALKMAEGKPYSYLRVTRAEIELPSAEPHSQAVYEHAKLNLKKMEREGIVFQEKESCFYVYRQTMNGREQYGLVACVRAEDYFKGTIKKHELTRADKEEDRLNHVLTTGAQTGPVFLTYRDKGQFALLKPVIQTAPVYDFVAEDGISHTVWVVNDEHTIERLRISFASLPCVYIADGHHRSAAGARAAEERAKMNPEHKGSEEYSRFLAILFPSSQLHILDYNRVVKDLNGKNEEDFLNALSEICEIKKLPGIAAPEKAKQFCLYLSGSWYSCDFYEKFYQRKKAIDNLDVSLLQNLVLKPMLGIDDPRTSKRIDFVGGIRGLGELQARVDSGECAAAFAMFPTSLDELMDIADANEIMPPKSTWFEPKLRDGLLVHLLD